MSSNFKLRQCIDAHDNDVKSLFILQDGSGFLSASRDLSVKLWQEQNDLFKNSHHYIFHKGYISVVHFMKPCLEYPNGVIFSAGYDKIINGYFINSAEVQFSLVGHTNAVTTLITTNNNELISGCMDGSACLWDLTSKTIKMSFKGHKHGIWSIILLNSLSEHFLTASADKEIFLWNLNSKEIKAKYIGHTDCVRGLIEVPKLKQFLSCSNDSTIRLWCLKTGSLLKIFRGHTSFIYSIAKLADETFVSCGENSSLYVWNLNNSSPIQIIHVNAQSIWCVSVLNNGDIVSGSSDGMIRLFSENSLLQNGVELKSKISNQSSEDQPVTALPCVGIEMLSIPGNYDQQLLKVRDEDCDILYEWSSLKDTWIRKKVLENVKPNESKTHDYVFSIDIKDGEPPLKLHFNNGQDPWVVAKKFLDDNDLSPMFLEQVANFIITNSNQQVSNLSSSSTNFNDPFTGSSRYIPVDSPQSGTVQYQFPYRSYFKYDKINASGLSKKLQEFSIGARLPDIIRTNIESIQTLSADQADLLCNWVLDKLAIWPDDQMFPLIDILRMLVRESACNSVCFADNQFLVKLISRTIGSQTGVCSKGNTLTMIKLMVNAFVHLPGEGLMNAMHKQIEDDLYAVAQSNTDKNILSAIASWLLNLSVSLNVRREEYRRNETIELCFRFLETFKLKQCCEAIHLLLVTIGTLVCDIDSFTFRGTLTMSVFERINEFKKIFNDETKWGVDVSNCSQQLGTLLASLDFMNF